MPTDQVVEGLPGRRQVFLGQRGVEILDGILTYGGAVVFIVDDVKK